MKNHILPKFISIVGVVALGFLFSMPSPANAVEAPATLTIIENVINDNGGTMTAAGFVLRIRDLNGDVVGSPFNGKSGAGTTFTLPAGSYLITEEDLPYVDGFPQYTSVFAGPAGIDSGYVTLAPGDKVTITRTNNDWPKGVAAGPGVPPNPVPPTPVTPAPSPSTVTGGELPATSSPSYNMLLVGFGLLLLGAVGFKSRKVLS